ncbi:hypothetical protein ACJX0J_035296, partial [Zea mays]
MKNNICVYNFFAYLNLFHKLVFYRFRLFGQFSPMLFMHVDKYLLIEAAVYKTDFSIHICFFDLHADRKIIKQMVYNQKNPIICDPEKEKLSDYNAGGYDLLS